MSAWFWQISPNLTVFSKSVWENREGLVGLDGPPLLGRGLTVTSEQNFFTRLLWSSTQLMPNSLKKQQSAFQRPPSTDPPFRQSPFPPCVWNVNIAVDKLWVTMWADKSNQAVALPTTRLSYFFLSLSLSVFALNVLFFPRRHLLFFFFFPSRSCVHTCTPTPVACLHSEAYIRPRWKARWHLLQLLSALVFFFFSPDFYTPLMLRRDQNKWLRFWGIFFTYTDSERFKDVWSLRNVGENLGGGAHGGNIGTRRCDWKHNHPFQRRQNEIVAEKREITGEKWIQNKGAARKITHSVSQW